MEIDKYQFEESWIYCFTHFTSIKWPKLTADYNLSTISRKLQIREYKLPPKLKKYILHLKEQRQGVGTEMWLRKCPGQESRVEGGILSKCKLSWREKYRVRTV